AARPPPPSCSQFQGSRWCSVIRKSNSRRRARQFRRCTAGVSSTGPRACFASCACAERWCELGPCDSVPRMDLTFSAEEEAFRQEVRAFIEEAMPPHIARKAARGEYFTHDELMQWQKILHGRGWAAPHWPKAFGGSEMDVTRRFILAEELALAGAPPLSPFGLSMVGPLIIRFGTPEQQQKHLPGIVSGEVAWCQGYSEP